LSQPTGTMSRSGKPLSGTEAIKSILFHMEKHLDLGLCATCAAKIVGAQYQMDSGRVFDVWSDHLISQALLGEHNASSLS
jgi:hypothetical protein